MISVALRLLGTQLRLDYVDNYGARTTPVENLSSHRNPLTGKRKELLVLTGRGRSVSDRPVNRSVAGQYDQRRTCFRARNCTLSANRFLEVLRERTSRVENVAVDGARLSIASGGESNGNEAKRER